MSAFVVEKRTIDRIVTYIKKRCRIRPAYMKKTYPAIWAAYENDADKLGERLWAMNVKAVNERYQEENPVSTYHYERRSEKSIQVYTSLRCLLYQCAEDDIPSWPLYKDLDRLLDELAHEIVRSLPEYERTEWT